MTNAVQLRCLKDKYVNSLIVSDFNEGSESSEHIHTSCRTSQVRARSIAAEQTHTEREAQAAAGSKTKF